MNLITDRNMEWKRKRIWIPAVNASGFSIDTPVGLHTGAPVWAEHSTFGYAGIKIEAAGDEYVHFLPLPHDVDVDHPIYIRTVSTTGSSTNTDAIDYILTYTAKAHGEVLAAAATALDTTIAADTNTGTANQLYLGAWGQIAASTLTEGDVLILEFELNSTDVDLSSEFIWYLGFQMEYTPRKMWGTDVLPEAQSN